MTPIRLVVSDVDGTLVDKSKQLTPATTDAVARVEAMGVPFTIISARPRSGMMPIADTLGIDHPMGAFNGGIVFMRDGRVIEHHMIDPEVARGMVALAADSDVETWVFAARTVVVDILILESTNLDSLEVAEDQRTCT